MKLLIILLSLYSSICYSQSISFGVDYGFLLQHEESNILQSQSTSPNLTVLVGNETYKGFVSLGNISRIGFLSMENSIYGGANYCLNLSKNRLEHGAEIHLGYYKKLGKERNFTLMIGSSVSMFVVDNRAKIGVRPIILGIFVTL